MATTTSISVEQPIIKSTNVRSVDWRGASLRGGLCLLERAAPSLAARIAERMFLSPRRHQRPDWEVELLRGAQRSSLRYRGQQLPTYSWGAGPSVLLLHGWEGRGSQLGAFVAPLTSAGFQVIAVDLPGHGDAAPTLTSVIDFAQAISALIQKLGPLHAIIAHSVGAAATTLAHTLSPFDARLVSIGAPRGPRRFFDGFIQHVGVSSKTGALVERRIEQRYGMALDAIDVERLGASVTLPTLVIHDRGDKEVPFDNGVAFAAALPGATLVATEGLGHRRILRDPGVIEAAVGFVSQPQQR